MRKPHVPKCSNVPVFVADHVLAELLRKRLEDSCFRRTEYLSLESLAEGTFDLTISVVVVHDTSGGI
jgi:hypothetical protein